MAEKGQIAIIVGASSVIGEALARELHKEVGALDFCRGAQKDYRPLGRIWETEYRLAMSKFQSTIASTDFTQWWKKPASNISCFIAIAQAAFRHFQQRGHGHLAAITSIAAFAK
jgi:NADP-dependent 3-hydroxy acid dehydrogenase YdfG